GTGRRSMLTRVFSSRVSRYCLAHAQCPVLTVPPPTMSPHASHGPLSWVFCRRALTPDRVLRDRCIASATTMQGADRLVAVRARAGADGGEGCCSRGGGVHVGGHADGQPGHIGLDLAPEWPLGPPSDDRDALDPEASAAHGLQDVTEGEGAPLQQRPEQVGPC